MRFSDLKDGDIFWHLKLGCQHLIKTANKTTYYVPYGLFTINQDDKVRLLHRTKGIE